MSYYFTVIKIGYQMFAITSQLPLKLVGLIQEST